jgi:hypothetical protein
MVERCIGQKAEIALVLMRWLRIAPTTESAITLLPDCGAPHVRTKVGTFEEVTHMTRWIAVLLAVTGLVGTTQAYAQEATPGPGRVEVSIIPAGGVFFTERTETQEPSFGNYDLGGAVAVNFNRFVGVEGEVSGALGITQDLQFGGSTSNLKTPDILNYSGNVVVSAANRSSVVPYVTAGVGGLSVFKEAGLGINDNQTFFTGNVGGGVKWYAGRWGLRGDYRFIGVQSKDDASTFFGSDTRYGHRVYGAVLLNVAR